MKQCMTVEFSVFDGQQRERMALSSLLVFLELKPPLFSIKHEQRFKVNFSQQHCYAFPKNLTPGWGSNVPEWHAVALRPAFDLPAIKVFVVGGVGVSLVDEAWVMRMRLSPAAVQRRIQRVAVGGLLFGHQGWGKTKK
jgi:hypothetical protein